MFIYSLIIELHLKQYNAITDLALASMRAIVLHFLCLYCVAQHMTNNGTAAMFIASSACFSKKLHAGYIIALPFYS